MADVSTKQSGLTLKMWNVYWLSRLVLHMTPAVELPQTRVSPCLLGAAFPSVTSSLSEPCFSRVTAAVVVYEFPSTAVSIIFHSASYSNLKLCHLDIPVKTSRSHPVSVLKVEPGSALSRHHSGYNPDSHCKSSPCSILIEISISSIISPAFEIRQERRMSRLIS